MHTSRLTQKFQTTVPAEIRQKLGLQKGDLIGFEYFEGQVILKKIEPLDLEFSRALEGTLNEWTSAHDDEAYGGL